MVVGPPGKLERLLDYGETIEFKKTRVGAIADAAKMPRSVELHYNPCRPTCTL